LSFVAELCNQTYSIFFPKRILAFQNGFLTTYPLKSCSRDILEHFGEITNLLALLNVWGWSVKPVC